MVGRLLLLAVQGLLNAKQSESQYKNTRPVSMHKRHQPAQGAGQRKTAAAGKAPGKLANYPLIIEDINNIIFTSAKELESPPGAAASIRGGVSVWCFQIPLNRLPSC